MCLLNILVASLLLLSLLYFVYWLASVDYAGAYVDEHSKRPIVIIKNSGGMVLSDGETQLPHRRSYGRHYFGNYRVKRRDGLVCLMDGSNCVMALRHDKRFRLRR